MLLSGGAVVSGSGDGCSNSTKCPSIANDHPSCVVCTESHRCSAWGDDGNAGGLEWRERLVDVANDEHERRAAWILRARIYRLPLDVLRLDHLNTQIRSRHPRNHPSQLR